MLSLLDAADVPRIRRFSVEDYRKMIDAGVFGESEPAELIEGVILKKFRPLSPRECYPQHAFRDLFGRTESHGWHVWLGTAITLSDSEPEPDAALLRGDETTFRARFAGPTEVGLVAEFADASLRFDRQVKGRVYARANIPVYWIVNVAERVIEVYTDPDPAADPPAYRTRTDFAPGQDVPLVLEGVEVGRLPVADLLP